MQPFSRMLIYFAEVARQGSVRRASEALNVSASAIDRQIIAAEDGLGVVLFSRLPSGMRLTAAGEILLRGVQDWRRDYRRIAEQIDDLSGLRRGHVRLAVIEAVAQGVLPGILDRMRSGYPGIELEILVLPNEEVAAAVAVGDCDAGLLLNPQSSRDITVRAFREVPLGVAMPVGHPLASRAGLRFSQLAGVEVIRPLPPLEIAEQFAALEAMSGLKLRTPVAANNIGLMRRLVARGAWLSVVSRIDVAADLAQGLIAFVPLTDAPLRPTTLALCHAHQGQMSSAARLLIRIIEEREVWDG